MCGLQILIANTLTYPDQQIFDQNLQCDLWIAPSEQTEPTFL